MKVGASADGALPHVAIVFTGQFERTHAGLDLLRQGQIEQLFISGVNPGAGMRIERFADEFGLDARLRSALEAGRINLGPRAQSTSQNALETACWLRARHLSGPILLITSQAHMPRASLALEWAVGGQGVERWSLRSERAPPSLEIIASEFLKFVVTAIAGLTGQLTPSDCR